MPELAVVLAYSKITLFDELLGSDVPEDPSFGRELAHSFPEVLRSRYPDRIREHPLRREIIATRVANTVVDRAGITFVFRLTEETGMAASDIVRAHTAAQEIFGLEVLWGQVAALDSVIDTGTQITLLLEVRSLAERATRWLLPNHPQPLDVAATVRLFQPVVRQLALQIPELVTEERREMLERLLSGHADDGVPEDLARSIVTLPELVAALDIATVVRSARRPVGEVAEVYFVLDECLKLNWLRARILDLPRDDRWQTMAVIALREDLHVVHAAVAAEVLRTGSAGAAGDEQVQRWAATVTVTRTVACACSTRSSVAVGSTSPRCRSRSVRSGR